MNMKLSKIRAAHLTRHLAGATIPRNGTKSISRGIGTVMKRADGGRCEVGGKPAMARLDRPGRKRGGPVNRWPGGRAGESDVEVRQSATDRAKELRSEADQLKEGALGKSAAGFGTALAGAIAGGLTKNKMLGTAIMRTGQGVGALGPISGMVDIAKGAKKDFVDAREADKTAAGKDRKFGGRAKRKAKDNDGDE